MDELEVRDWRPVLGLVEEGFVVDCVEGRLFRSVGWIGISVFFFFFLAHFHSPLSIYFPSIPLEDKQFNRIQLRLLGQDLVNVWFEPGVRVEKVLAQTALDGRLDFGFRTRGDALTLSVYILPSIFSFLFFFFALVCLVFGVSCEALRGGQNQPC